MTVFAHMTRRCRRSCAARGADGQAMVEFAVVLPFLLMLVFAGIQFGTVFLQWQQLSSATSEGARRAIVSRNEANRDTITRDAVRNAAPSLKPADLTVTVSSSWNAGSPVTVTSTYPASINLPFLPGAVIWSGNLSNSRTMRVEQ